ncbi:hypothetical protein CALVIDRAFT_528197 [Calocera viscosa TUFC12733]|uniref:Uncharacterized protein n=1 Tax=Calocera viscosa (strain TUFC12733) TaxID=1330018 RepID=A0A167L9N0_CALVF|nr:hypothetical protein CALVIDRAFT_528197 [Calocera viscosa TUFC12733]
MSKNKATNKGGDLLKELNKLSAATRSTLALLLAKPEELTAIVSERTEQAIQLTTLDTVVDTMQEDIETLKVTVSELKENVGDLTNRIEVLEEKVLLADEKYESQKEELKEELSLVHERLTELEAATVDTGKKSTRGMKRSRLLGDAGAAEQDTHAMAAAIQAPVTKKPKYMLTEEEAHVRESIQDSGDSDGVGKMPGKGVWEPEAPSAAPAYLIPDWNLESNKGINAQIIQRAIDNVRSMHKVCQHSIYKQHDGNSLTEQPDANEPLVPSGSEIWLTPKALKSLAVQRWATMKATFKRQHNEDLMRRREMEKLENRIGERQKTARKWLSIGAKIVAANKGYDDELQLQLCLDLVHAEFAGEERSCDEDGTKNNRWWKDICSTGRLGAAQKKDRNSAWERKRPIWMSVPVYQTFLYHKEQFDLTQPKQRVTNSTVRVDLKRTSNLTPREKPWDFMVDPVWKATQMNDHHNFPGIKEGRPPWMTAEVESELRKVDGDWVHAMFWLERTRERAGSTDADEDEEMD